MQSTTSSRSWSIPGSPSYFFSYSAVSSWLCLSDGIQCLIFGDEGKATDRAEDTIDEASTQLLADLEATMTRKPNKIDPDLKAENGRLRAELMTMTGLQEAYRARLLGSLENSRQ